MTASPSVLQKLLQCITEVEDQSATVSVAALKAALLTPADTELPEEATGHAADPADSLSAADSAEAAQSSTSRVCTHSSRNLSGLGAGLLRTGLLDWSADVLALCSKAVPKSRHRAKETSVVRVYTLCDGMPYGPTKATQQGLMQVRWADFGLKAERAEAGTIQGTGVLEVEHIADSASQVPGEPVWQLDSIVVSILAPQTDSTGEPSDAQQRAGARRASEPRHNAARALVASATQAALQALKAELHGAWGMSKAEAKLQPLQAELADCLISIVRSAHNPALLPFTCNALQCQEAALSTTIKSHITTACANGLARLVDKPRTAPKETHTPDNTPTDTQQQDDQANTETLQSQMEPLYYDDYTTNNDINGTEQQHTVSEWRHDGPSQGAWPESQPVDSKHAQQEGASRGVQGRMAGDHVQLSPRKEGECAGVARGKELGPKARDLHTALQQLYGVRPVAKRSKKQQPDSGSSSWLF